MSWTVISNHVEKATDRLLEQYKNKPKIVAFLTGFVTQIQDLESGFNQLSTDRSIETAVGVQLDKLGDIIGIARIPGQLDEPYRLAIKEKIILNLNSGTPEQVIAAVYLYLGLDPTSGPKISYNELFPAAVEIFADGFVADQDQVDAVREKIQRTLPAGVSLETFGYFDAANAFRFDASPGFGSTTDSGIGGTLAGLYT